jgi:alginate O-acetyltransferase complex protein AlgI
MLFNSLHFLFFFPAVVALYFATPARYRWALLLAASYYFYAAWRLEYVVLIMVSTLADYLCGLRMGRLATKRERKPWLILTLVVNLGLLFVFKYLDFFGDSLRALFNQFNIFYDVPAYNLLLPVGISFYTFQTLSYSIEVYRGNQKPERHLGIFALYVSFFPQLVAGPIERSTRLLPQFWVQHGFDASRAASGFRLILWGFFKKIVIADRLAIYVNDVYGNPGAQDGLTLLVATYFFAFQIYCDFSAYSDIAIGSARIMGYDLMQNFRRPYFARSIQEFWQRWHISLSTWFRDYVYIPLGGNRVPKWRWYVNLMAVFLVSGLWHGAAWTFVVWGALHGGYLIVGVLTLDVRERAWQALERLAGRPAGGRVETVPGLAPVGVAAGGAGIREANISLAGLSLMQAVRHTARWDGRLASLPGAVRSVAVQSPRLAVPGLATLRYVLAVICTFHLVLFAWIFFRADSFADAATVIGGILTGWPRSLQVSGVLEPYGFMLAVLSVAFLVGAQVLQSRFDVGERIAQLWLPVRWAAYYAIILATLMFGAFGGQEFIYFQF